MSTETSSPAFLPSASRRYSWQTVANWFRPHRRPGLIPPLALTTILADFIGVFGGYGAILFLMIIEAVEYLTIDRVLQAASDTPLWLWGLCTVPALGLLVVGWLTQRFAPEAEGHGGGGGRHHPRDTERGADCLGNDGQL